MNNVFIIDANDLRNVVREVVIDAFAEVQKSQPAPKKIPTDAIDSEGAVEYLKELGYKISIHTIRNKVHLKEIPYAKCANRLVFSRAELKKWVEANRYIPTMERATSQMAKVANNQKD